MRQVYVDVSLVPKPSQDTVHEPYVGIDATSAYNDRRTLESFLGNHRRLAVIGGPGTGKTTLVRNTALICSRRGWRIWKRTTLPILLYMRDHAEMILSQASQSLAEVAVSAGWLAGKIPAVWVEKRLDRGGCIVLLDGLDEVADESHRGQVVAWVKRQIERYPYNDYVLTSRPYGYLSNPLPNAEVLQVRRFTGGQISHFLHNWYYAIECRAVGAKGARVRAISSRKADDLFHRIRQQSALHDLAANPLLLTMVANVHRYRGQLPGSRSELYAEMCDVLLHRRQEAKDLENTTGLRGHQKEHVMRHLALDMMTAQVRDIHAADAERAIQKSLRLVSPGLSPVTFLQDVCRSGLLVEREHDIYAFAHLTLQEYLAAAQIREKRQLLSLLTDNVDDVWWRECTLLWAAAADATPVIEACLISGSYRALTLAFDCADEAREVDPGVRGRLEEFLSNTDAAEKVDVARRRLVDGVKATRFLRDTIWIDEGSAVCAQAVSNELYGLFVRNELAAGRYVYNPALRDVTLGYENSMPAVGANLGEVERFVAWLNSLFDGGQAYRLPDAEEVSSPAVKLVKGIGKNTIWIRNKAELSLFRPEVAPWPYAASSEDVRRYPVRDRKQTSLNLRLALVTPGLEFDRILVYGHALATARAQMVHQERDNPKIGVYKLMLMLELGRSLLRPPNQARAQHIEDLRGLLNSQRATASEVRARSESLASELGLDFTFLQDTTSYVDPFAYDKALKAAIEHAQPELGERNHPEILARANALDRQLDFALGIGHKAFPYRDFAIGLDFCRNLNDGLSLESAHEAVHKLCSILKTACDGGGRASSVASLAQEVARIGDVARDVQHALGHVRHYENEDELRSYGSLNVYLDSICKMADSLSRNLTSDLASALDNGFISDLEAALGRAYARACDLERAIEVSTTRRRELEDMVDLANDLDLASELSLQTRVKEIHVLVRSYRIILRLWKPQASRSLGELDEYIADLLAKHPISTPIRENPRNILKGAIHEVQRSQHRQPSQVFGYQVSRLKEVDSFIGKIFDGIVPINGESMAVARMELIATLAMLDKVGNNKAGVLVAQSFASLVALQEHAEGSLRANEIILLGPA
ncbi:NACHT domain-containing protein [Nonomuraea sp. NPDC049625]|uniref:NACHT domain-containing protein n=1 Tax=Nonomuraea sp. NPDC049625 TaxID=3155775 RepID=UPI00343268DF